MTTFLEASVKKVVAVAAQNRAPSPARHILLVDDNIPLLKLNAEVLTGSGYIVDTAADGADAWQALRDINYDLLITDHKMPRLTGLELIKKLRSESKTLPIILASGMLPTEELKQHPWLHIDALLPKPFTIASLLGAVREVLNAMDSVAKSARLFGDGTIQDD